MPHISYHSDDLQYPPSSAIRDRKSLADWVLIGEEPFSHRLANYHNPGSAGNVLVCECPAAEYWNAHCAEIVRADRAIVRRGVFTAREGAPFDEEGETVVIATKRKRMDSAGRLNSGESRDPIQDLLDESSY